MSGPMKKFDGGNVNFLVTYEQREALDAEAKRRGVYRSDVLRDIIREWVEGNLREQHAA